MHAPSTALRHALAALFAAAALHGASAVADDADVIVDIGGKLRPAIIAIPDTAALPDCASNPDRLGISRVVEIDATGGPEFGGQNAARNDFLNDREVVLTFDDGPMRSHTRRVLEALADHCTRATFFMVGRMAAADPAMVEEVVAAGHTAATHTWSHKNLRSVGARRAEQEFEMGIAAVVRASRGRAAPFFRYPYLSESRAIRDLAADRGIATFWIDVDSKDYLSRDPVAVQHRVMAQLNAKGKGIILMHDIQLSTVKAIGPLLDELHLRGYKVVHIVPKAPAAALPDYEAAVAKAFGDKAAAITGNPLADRSVVWSATPPDQQMRAERQRAQPGRQSNTPRRGPQSSKQTTAAPGGDLLPWLEPGALQSPPPRAAGKTPAADPWNLFSY